MPERVASNQKSRPPLSRERIIREAMNFADEEGVDSLTMRKLADRLRVEAMSLYHHVANKEDILDGMVDAAFAEIDLPQPGSGWMDAMRVRAHAARRVLVNHRWAIGLMESRPNPGPATLHHHDAVIGCLRGAGFSIAMAAHAFSAIDSYIYGFVLQEINLPFTSAEELEGVADAILEAMPAEEFPHMTEMIEEHALKPGYAYADEFDFGLELILEGLERALGPASGDSARS